MLKKKSSRRIFFNLSVFEFPNISRLLSKFNAVMALSWGPAGVLIGGPLADIQVRSLGLSTYAAYVNTFYVSSIIVACGTILFAVKVAMLRLK